ncbi:hypothetical protein CIG66_25275 (plasmid) [Ralstonia pseudosolanacearum]|nr:hypothetical protein CIG66_16935 [Ralstonia pseudosolanacearum]AST89630.1 hypothetical protein CIG66_25275 [Ralstonia pseudosolanacearum]
MNALQEELASFIEWAGLLLNKADNTQLRQALIAKFAQLSGAAFTATPTAPTVPQFDNSQKLVNSAFLKSSGLSYASAQIAIGASRSLAASDIGAHLVFQATSTLTVPSPASLGVRSGDSATISCFGGYTGTVAFSGTTYTYDTAGKSSSITVYPGETLTLIATATGWQIGPSTAGMGSLGSFSSGVQFQKLPGGRIFQWGSFNVGSVSNNAFVTGTLTFPIAFPTACRSAVFNSALASAASTFAGSWGAASATSCPWFAQNQSGTSQTFALSWMAFGD